MNYLKVLKNLEQELKSTDLKLAGYLQVRKKYRYTDADDIKKQGLKWFRQNVKTNNDFKLFQHYYYYLGKSMAYQYILYWLIQNWHRLENKETFLEKLWNRKNTKSR